MWCTFINPLVHIHHHHPHYHPHIIILTIMIINIRWGADKQIDGANLSSSSASGVVEIYKSVVHIYHNHHPHVYHDHPHQHPM